MIKLLKTTLFANDLEYLRKNEPKLWGKVQKLCIDIVEHPFEGLGKPEPLKYQFGGVWSRRIDRKNRLLYMLTDNDTIKLLSCRGHYE